MKIYEEINKCRICGNQDLIELINLGEMSLTGIFPKNKIERVNSGPLRLVKCNDFISQKKCGLVQLRHNFKSSLLYGDNYGYRSGLNNSMVDHLSKRVQEISTIVDLKRGDFIIDIGSNDGTMLKLYTQKGLNLVGVDPTGIKFKEFYNQKIKLIDDFFPSNTLINYLDGNKAKVITSIAMFYDLEDPISFMRNIVEILDDQGIWVFEQSYLLSMLNVVAYDTICHEHLEYYSLKQIKFMTDLVGLKIVNIEFNDTNGGSFSIVVAKNKSSYKEHKLLRDLLKKEISMGLSDSSIYDNFSKSVKAHKKKLLEFMEIIKKEKKKILGYGASTKGNVILQYCGITDKDIPFIAEINHDKFGSYTPGSQIPIISEDEAKRMNPDYLMVLPWHFKQNIIEREKVFIQGGGHLFFPLPKLTIV